MMLKIIDIYPVKLEPDSVDSDERGVTLVFFFQVVTFRAGHAYQTVTNCEISSK